LNDSRIISSADCSNRNLRSTSPTIGIFGIGKSSLAYTRFIIARHLVCGPLYAFFLRSGGSNGGDSSSAPQYLRSDNTNNYISKRTTTTPADKKMPDEKTVHEGDFSELSRPTKQTSAGSPLQQQQAKKRLKAGSLLEPKPSKRISPFAPSANNDGASISGEFSMCHDHHYFATTALSCIPLFADRFVDLSFPSHSSFS
jgi:hypothetical protein